MESNKQEKYNLLHDNPVAKHASGGSWMSKHAHQSRMGSPLQKWDRVVEGGNARDKSKTHAGEDYSGDK